MKIDIIGAGIGGLITAIALKKKGFEVRIFEQTGRYRRRITFPRDWSMNLVFLRNCFEVLIPI